MRKIIIGVILATNLGLGLILWLYYLTDYSWENIILKAAFPPIALLVSVPAFFLVKKNLSGRTKLLTCFPLLTGGIFYAVMLLPLALSMIFLLPYYELVQQEISPDGQWVAEVYRRPWVDNLEPRQVRIHHRLVPFIERIVCNDYRIGYGYIAWLDDDTLHIKSRLPLDCATRVEVWGVGPAQEVMGVHMYWSRYAIYIAIPLILLALTGWYAPEIIGFLKKLLNR